MNKGCAKGDFKRKCDIVADGWPASQAAMTYACTDVH